MHTSTVYCLYTTRGGLCYSAGDFRYHDHTSLTGAASLAVCVYFLPPVLSIVEEALLSDCQDLSNPNQTVLISSTWQHHQGHAHLQEGRARHRSGQTMPQP